MATFITKTLLSIALTTSCIGAAYAQSSPAVTHTQTLNFDSFGEAHGVDSFSAITGSPNYQFQSNFNFAVSQNSDLDSGFISIASKNRDLTFTSFGLYNAGGSLLQAGASVAGSNAAGQNDAWTLNFSNLSSTNYRLTIFGNVLGTSGGSLNLSAVLAPVPEPETWGMLLGGLSVIGIVARRKKRVATGLLA